METGILIMKRRPRQQRIKINASKITTEFVYQSI